MPIPLAVLRYSGLKFRGFGVLGQPGYVRMCASREIFAELRNIRDIQVLSSESLFEVWCVPACEGNEGSTFLLP